MGRLNSNENVTKGNICENNIELKMSRLIPENRESLSEPVPNELTTTSKNNDTDTEREIDEGLLPSSRNGPKQGNGEDFDVGDSQSPFDVNLYQHKKTLAQGMMDLALFSANANQLRYVLELAPASRSVFFYMSLILILLSLILQGAVGIGLIWNGRYNIKKSCDHHNANRANNLTLIGIFLITITNVFISAFGIPTTTQTRSVFNSNRSTP